MIIIIIMPERGKNRETVRNNHQWRAHINLKKSKKVQNPECDEIERVNEELRNISLEEPEDVGHRQQVGSIGSSNPLSGWANDLKIKGADMHRKQLDSLLSGPSQMEQQRKSEIRLYFKGCQKLSEHANHKQLPANFMKGTTKSGYSKFDIKLMNIDNLLPKVSIKNIQFKKTMRKNANISQLLAGRHDRKISIQSNSVVAERKQDAKTGGVAFMPRTQVPYNSVSSKNNQNPMMKTNSEGCQEQCRYSLPKRKHLKANFPSYFNYQDTREKSLTIFQSGNYGTTKSQLRSLKPSPRSQHLFLPRKQCRKLAQLLILESKQIIRHQEN